MSKTPQPFADKSAGVDTQKYALSPGDYQKLKNNIRDREVNQTSTAEEKDTQIDEDTADTEKIFSALPTAEKSSLKVYLREISRVPLLTPQEEFDYAQRSQQGDEEARDKMIQANLRLVVKIAHDYNNFGLPLLDLISEGNIGLIKAVERFDPTKGGKLSTYAAWWIRQSIKRALANQSKTIRLPVHLVDKISRMRKVINRLSDELEREPTNDEVAYEMDMPVNKIAHLKSVSVRPASLDAPVSSEDDTQFGDLVGDENAMSPFENLRAKSQLADIRSLLSKLEEREADIIRMRFGFKGDRPMTLEEVGAAFDITRERVRQLQNMALVKMRKAMIDNERQRNAKEIQTDEMKKQRMMVIQDFFYTKVKTEKED